MKDGYGMKFGDLLMYFDHDTSSCKMSQDYLQQTKGKPSKELSKIFPKAGCIDSNGKLYQQDQLVRHTLEKDSSESVNWPTPSTQDNEHKNLNLNEKGRRVAKNGGEDRSLNLADKVQVATWETPNTMDHLPPRSGEALENVLYRGDKERKSKRKSTGNLRENSRLQGKRLNYGWVTRLMGFPDGWLN